MTRVPLNQRGIAIIAVLWLLVLLAGVALAIASRTRSETQTVFALYGEAEARALAEGAIHRGIERLLAPSAAAGAAITGYERRVEEKDGIRIDIEIRDECGKVDLNTGRARLIEGLLARHASSEDAFAITQAILDWRDPDGQRRPQGAEDNDYRALGRRSGARDGPFETVAELAQVKGMTPVLLDRVAPDLTVDCGAGRRAGPVAAGHRRLPRPPRRLAGQSASEPAAGLGRSGGLCRGIGGRCLRPPCHGHAAGWAQPGLGRRRLDHAER
jgi:general secretion pathway protein K